MADQSTEQQQQENQQGQGQQQNGNNQSRQPVPAGNEQLFPEALFDPSRRARLQLLRLARHWREMDSTYQATSAYTKLLVRYPGTHAAEAAAEEMLEMAQDLEERGQFYTAMSIINKVEVLT